MKIVLYALLVYVLLTAVIFFMQRRLLYLPDTTRPSDMSVQAAGLAFWPASDSDYRGLISAGHQNDPKGTVIVFHGNAGRAVDRSYYVQALTPLGYRVLLAEYPGYGGRNGWPSEASLIADAKEIVELAHQEFGYPIYLWGESLGCGVVTAIAADTQRPVAAVILVTPWDSLPNLAQTIYWFLPARWLVMDKFDNVKNLHAYPGRVAVVLAGQDEVIPTRHSQRLYEAITSSKKLWVFDQAGHNSLPMQPGESWWKEVMTYVY
ncbi:lysophospholipase [Chloroflexi bacterium TSY]|nr:lysophospholipase [Chloroflexi bacterium TSY]